MVHVAHSLQRYLDGVLPPQEREQVAAHLAACPRCSEERELLLSARALMPPLAALEPRIGFAPMVALNARDRRVSPFARWVRFSVAGIAVAAAAAVAVMVSARPAQRSEELMVAQRLDLFEDMTVIQNREALEDLDVVAVLHTLQPEARP